MTPRHWLLLGILAAIWGSSYFFMKIAVAEVGPLSIAFARCALGAVVLAAALYAGRRTLPHGWRDWAALALLGAVGSAIPFALIAWGEEYIDSGLAAVLNATTPMFAVLLLHFATREEPLTVPRGLGVSAGLAGVAVLMGQAALAGLGQHLLAQLAVLLAALMYAAAALYIRRLKHLSVLAIGVGQLTASALLALPGVLLLERPLAGGWPIPLTIASLLALGLVSTALAYTIYYRLVAEAGAANATLVTFLIPVSATLLGTLILGERIGLRHLAGMALIAAGLVAIDNRLRALATRGRW